MPVFRQDGRAVLFVHVPKAGGSSLERLFAKSGWTTGYRDPKGGVGSMNPCAGARRSTCTARCSSRSSASTASTRSS